MKNVKLQINVWSYVLLLPLVTIAISLILTHAEMPAIQFVHATVWGVGLVLLAAAVNLDNRSAPPLVVLGLVLPTLALVNLFAQPLLIPLTTILVAGWIVFAIWQVKQSNSNSRSAAARVVPLELRNSKSAHLMKVAKGQIQVLDVRTG